MILTSQRIEEKKASHLDQYLRVAKVHYSGPMRGDSCARPGEQYTASTRLSAAKVLFDEE